MQQSVLIIIGLGNANMDIASVFIQQLSFALICSTLVQEIISWTPNYHYTLQKIFFFARKFGISMVKICSTKTVDRLCRCKFNVSSHNMFYTWHLSNRFYYFCYTEAYKLVRLWYSKLYVGVFIHIVTIPSNTCAFIPFYVYGNCSAALNVN